MAKKKRNLYFDMLKSICAVFVVIIHITAYISTFATFRNYWFYRQALDMAVPVFFAVSGYYTFKKHDNNLSQISKKSLNLFLVLSVIYIVFGFFGTQITTDIPNPFLMFTIENVLNGRWGSFHLWYLWALSLSYFLLHTLKSRQKLLFFLISFLYFVKANGGINFGPYLAYGSFITGIFFIGIGKLAIRNRLSLIENTILAILFFILFYIRLVINPNGSSNLYLALLVYFLISIGNCIECNELSRLKYSPQKYSMTRYSDKIYFYHIMAMGFIHLFVPLFSEAYHNFPISIIIGLILVITISVVLGIVFNPLEVVLKEKVDKIIGE